MAVRKKKADTHKQNGIHYTPPDLARFLADAIVQQVSPADDEVRILDPACGDGGLLDALIQAVPRELRQRCVLVGYETDAAAAEAARSRLRHATVASVMIHVADFLNQPDSSNQTSYTNSLTRSDQFDAVIANPPYVRTQVLGAIKAQSLAKQFHLTGRVDLYHAFVRHIATVLKPEGVLGLLTSNRFLTIKSGESIRKLMWREFNLKQILDLGDTRLFKAAVLPAIVVAQRRGTPAQDAETDQIHCKFDRVYECRDVFRSDVEIIERDSVLESLRQKDVCGIVKTPAGAFRIERGELRSTGDDSLWSLTTPDSADWLAKIARHQSGTFDDVAKIRVGIKTTADEVFISNDWSALPEPMRPEPSLIRPLIRHFDAERWLSGSLSQSVLYPYEDCDKKRRPVELNKFPRANKYLRRHQERLTQRHYLIEAGRAWYEIWVPHSPAEWSYPKIVFPDISEEPKFFLDQSGAIVNGDCYWITLREGVDPAMLLLILAVANSSLIKKYYDIAFHNKLYSGRRRYMTQYVKKFPLPDEHGQWSRAIIDRLSPIVEGKCPSMHESAELDKLVWRAFGMEQDAC